MSADPFPGRCRHCGIGLMDDLDYCGRGEACKSAVDHLRAVVAGACSLGYRAARWLGMIR